MGEVQPNGVSSALGGILEVTPDAPQMSLLSAILSTTVEHIVELVDRSLQNWILDGVQNAFDDRIIEWNGERTFLARVRRTGKTCKNCKHYRTLYNDEY